MNTNTANHSLTYVHRHSVNYDVIRLLSKAKGAVGLYFRPLSHTVGVQKYKFQCGLRYFSIISSYLFFECITQQTFIQHFLWLVLADASSFQGANCVCLYILPQKPTYKYSAFRSNPNHKSVRLSPNVFRCLRRNWSIQILWLFFVRSSMLLEL